MYMFNVKSKPTGSQFSLLHEPNYKVNGKTKKKTIEQSGVRKGSLVEGLWSKEKVSFEKSKDTFWW